MSRNWLALSTLRRQWRLPIVAAIIIGTVPLYGSDYNLSQLQFVLFYALGAMALNFAFGYGGQLAIGQPVLIGAAAYVAGVLSIHFQWGFWQTFVPGVAAAVLISLMLGLPSLRVQGFYLAVLTIFAIGVLPNLVEAWAPLTGGDNGLFGILPLGFGEFAFPTWAVYETFFLAVALVFVGIANIVNSGWGLTLLTLRDNPIVVESCGVNPAMVRTRVFWLSAIPCGIAGVLLAHGEQFVSTPEFTLNLALLFIAAVFLGGRGTLWGPLVGIAIFESISLYLGPFSPYNALLLGLGVLIVAVAFQGGVVPVLARLVARLQGAAAEPNFALGAPSAIEHGQAGDLVVSGISKSFGGNLALNRVDLSLAAGKVVGLVGANGSGKTTLLNIISGFVRPDVGRLTFKGDDLARMRPYERARLGLGRSFQVPKLVPQLTVRENVEVGIVGLGRQRVWSALWRLPGFRRREAARRQLAQQICQSIGFGQSLIDLPAGRLPLGLQRLVEIGRVLGCGSSLVCLDEPVAGLNSEEQGQVAGIIRRIAESGRTVLLVEHNLGFVRDLVDLIVLLKDGCVVETGNLASTLDSNTEIGRYFLTYVAKEPATI